MTTRWTLPLFSIPLPAGRRFLPMAAPALIALAGALTGCANPKPAAAVAAAPVSVQTSGQADNAKPATAHADNARRQEAMQSQPTPPQGKEIATLAGGCFWCTEAIFQELKGVDKVEPGYAGGHTANPTYREVCTGTTGHAEAIQITFDPKVISFHDLLMIFFTTHNPTTLNRQGADVGTQYRSSVFTHSPQQKETAAKAIQEIEGQHIWPDRIVTEVVPFTNFYPAEAYHHDYFESNPQQPYCQMVIAPKVAKFREHFRDKLKR